MVRHGLSAGHVFHREPRPPPHPDDEDAEVDERFARAEQADDDDGDESEDAKRARHQREPPEGTLGERDRPPVLLDGTDELAVRDERGEQERGADDATTGGEEQPERDGERP